MIKRGLAGLLALTFAFSTAFAVSAEKTEASSDAASTIDYSEYISEQESLLGKGTEVTVKGNDFLSQKGAQLKKSEGLEWNNEDGSVTWEFKIKQDGAYNLVLEYDPLGEGTDAAEISIKVDGEFPFDEAKSVFLPRLFQNDGEIRKDDEGNEFAPKVKQKEGFNSIAVFDPAGFNTEPLAFVLGKGTHKLTLELLEIPIKKEFAKLYHSYPSNIMPDETGGTDNSTMYAGSGFMENKNMSSGFSSVIFLGNDEKGFFTYAESDKDWQPADAKKTVEFIAGEDEVVLKLNIIDGQPQKWADIKIEDEHGQYEYPDISYRLYFQATPVKPFPENPYKEKQLHIDCFKKIPQEYIDFLSNPVVEGSDEIGYDRIKRLGVTTLILHEKWNQVQNYWKLTKRTEHQLRTIIEECHKRGIKVVTYFGYEISTMSDIWYDKAELYKRKGREMKKGLGWYRFPAQREVCVCYNSPFADEFAKGLEKLADEYSIDGIYLDGTAMVWNCQNTAHGCGYYDKDGNLHSTFPISGVRRLMRRLYEIFESRGKTINCHVSDCICPAGIAFAHSLWLGEYIQYSLVKYGADEMPEGYLRATHSGRNFGLPTEFIVYENKPIWSFNDAFAFSLVHGVLPRPNDIAEPLEKVSEIWNIIDSFPVDKSKWCPYYDKASHPFVSSDDSVKISGYRYEENGENRWLLFVANSKTAKVENCIISGFNGFSYITDAEKNTEISVENGKISLNFDRFEHYIFNIKE